jgi:hypothetical protein
VEPEWVAGRSLTLSERYFDDARRGVCWGRSESRTPWYLGEAGGTVSGFEEWGSVGVESENNRFTVAGDAMYQEAADVSSRKEAFPSAFYEHFSDGDASAKRKSFVQVEGL